MRPPAKPLVFETKDEWRAWLEENHTKQKQAWLIIRKKASTESGLQLGEAVEEALCFGWIDSTLRSMDDKRYALRFSPRQGNSIWSEHNKRRTQKLIRAGRMTGAGLRKIAEARKNGQWEAATRREKVDVIPSELEKQLRRHKGALAAYRALPASRKKQFIHWLTTAKRDTTKSRRAQIIVEEVLQSMRG